MNHRARLADDNDPFAREYLDCARCTLDCEQRKRVACGWIPERDRTGVSPVPAGYPNERPDICGGYLVSLPQVIEAARAASWRREGALAQFYDGKPLTELTKTAIDYVAASMREVENYNIRQSHEG